LSSFFFLSAIPAVVLGVRVMKNWEVEEFLEEEDA